MLNSVNLRTEFVYFHVSAIIDKICCYSNHLNYQDKARDF